MSRRMDHRAVTRGRWTILALYVTTFACLTSVTFGVKVAERSLNVTSHEVENTESNEILQVEMPRVKDEEVEKTPVFPANVMFDPGFKTTKVHPHTIADKPTKFDLDISGMLHTDRKNLHDAEAERLNNLSTIPPSTQTMDRMDDVEECTGGISMACLKEGIVELLDDMDNVDSINVTESVQIVKTRNATGPYNNFNLNTGKYDIIEKVHRFAKNHVLRIRMPNELVTYRQSRTFFGAFGLKKLLIPLILGAQLIKSVLVALFLPSIIGSLGKIVGKGLSSFAQSSQGATAQPEENFEFKDNSDLYSEDYMTRQPLGTLPASAMYDESMLTQAQKPEIASRFSFVDPRITNANSYSDRYYTRHVANSGLSKKQDFKVFHEIPTSSLLLTNYDPFYSPLLSRLDAVFSRLGHTTEGCREFAVCAMYRNPARYAPYSNLVSAQLSRELNELRRPSSDNPDVLRFFRYMKAAKDGQDGVRCEETYSSCDVARDDPNLRQNQAMLATYQDIDKLVHARKL